MNVYAALTNVGDIVGILLGLPEVLVVVGTADGAANIGASVGCSDGRAVLGDIVSTLVGDDVVVSTAATPGLDALAGLDGIGLSLFGAGFGAGTLSSTTVCVVPTPSSSFVTSSAAIAESFPQRVA